MTHPTKPAGVTVGPNAGKTPQRPGADMAKEIASDEMERYVESQRLERLRASKLDKVMKKLKSWCKLNAVFPFLVNGQGFTISVSQFYPDLKLVVDKFYDWNDMVRKEIDMKKKVFAKNGLKYFWLTPTDAPEEYRRDLVDLEI